jgi:hypothetical protein
MKKFNEFQELREAAIILAGVDEKTCKLSDYIHKIEEAAAIKKEMTDYFLNEMEEVKIEFDMMDESEGFNESELNEGELNEKVDLKTSTNPLAKMFRWAATLRAKAKITAAYKASLAGLATITANEIKLEVKKDEIGKVAGPEAKVKMKEIDAMIETIKQKKELVTQKRQEAVDKTLNPGFFGAGGTFGLNKDVLDKHIALMNTQEKLQIAEMKVTQAQKILTDKEMKTLKDSVKQLKAREAKYAQESKNIEQAVANAVEKQDFTEADQEIKVEAERQKEKIKDIDKDLDDLRAKISDEADEEKKKGYEGEYKAMMADRSKAEKDLDKLAKKAAKTVLGSSSKEKE